MTTDERKAAEAEFLAGVDRVGRRATPAHPDCTCLAGADLTGHVTRTVRATCPQHAPTTTTRRTP
jgi:hypothetical protein